MSERAIPDLLAELAFFRGMDAARLAFIAGCGVNRAFRAGEFLARQDAPADEFFAIRRGRVAIELHAPGRGAIVLQTCGPGEVVGFSWIFPPYRWSFDVRATDELGVVRFDGACLRAKCEADPALGYDLMKRFAGVFAERLEQARMQLLDLYGDSCAC